MTPKEQEAFDMMVTQVTLAVHAVIMSSIQS
jgi:hypothetical protein